MSHQVPSTMRALITQANKTAKVEEVPVPTINDDEVLAKVIAVSQNPTDWKHVHNVQRVGTICGCDFAGRVVKVGKNVKHLAVGDMIAAFVHGGTYKDKGSFAEYAKARAEVTWKVPDNITPEQASTMNCACWTIAQAFYGTGRLGLVEPPAKADKEEWIFISGGSSSAGMYALQLAHLSGYKVITVASTKNFDLCKSLGADVVVDYKDPDVASKIKQLSNSSITRVFDAISSPESQVLCASVIGPKGGKVLTLLDPEDAADGLRPDVEIITTLLYTSQGEAFDMGGQHFPASLRDRAEMAQWLKKQTGYVAQGLLKPNPVKLMEGGLEGIPAGFQYMIDGKVSGEKLVYRISD